MKSLLACVIALVLVAPALAQRTPVSAPVDPDLEKFANHNLDVARQYFKRKAWAGTKDRLEEILAEYPEFTKVDEVYYTLGVCYMKLDDDKLARESFQKVVDDRPDSPFAKRSKDELDRLGPAPSPK